MTGKSRDGSSIRGATGRNGEMINECFLDLPVILFELLIHMGDTEWREGKWSRGGFSEVEWNENGKREYIM